ncbi:DEAD/DEAH box helicase [Burkholderia ambifaria]|uniref:DNA helicase related protein n=1 Tax=Burkholderia ambifaria (strain ATCC BAA-244 / DSM 16087 / CCUG 44356 / LMG 19182 / AMMD) TaxID=339670 RepID=Q0B501_BURCM|nr:DEAD/DEAH box helicase [Burkholderia ambifaria]ABI90772.1 DNA helicase related protein [Burkholderia ambifaria AMMD]MBR7933039.1 ATP-binding protein [Burkholderia ambifaria]QQC06629.1 ATP-binding protein [Burkholderia ambifaria]UZU02069.1 ATP-binding protein [Burkholderia ambifaria]UZU08621.1 ATP-binding protein [Burkholderia ambifaria]
MTDTASVLRYWRAIEIFCPQSVPKVKPEDKKTPTNDFRAPNAIAPWDKRHAVMRRRIGNDAWRHEVYAGVYPVRALRDLLQEKFGADPDSYDERLDIDTALFCLSVTHDGRVLFDNAVLSTCAWAWGRTISPGPSASNWLEGYAEFAKKFDSQLRQELALEEGDEAGHKLQADGISVGRPVTLGDIGKVSAWLLRELHIEMPEISDGMRISSRRVPERYAYEADGADFLNSFFMDDLSLVASQVEAGNVGPALHEYLAADGAVDESRRVDVRQKLALPFHSLAPEVFPHGRWPSKGHHPLVYGQQFAINQLLEQVEQTGGLFGINGPPGTGKTTLLRDLVASVVVSRALALSKLSSPAQAFTGVASMKAQDKERTVKLWSDALSGFEIVVASANNGAVENVTLDIPGIDAVDASWAQGFDYFSEFASRVIEKPAWGLLAARLGSKANRAIFRKRFWQDESRESSEASGGDGAEKKPGFSSWLYSQNSALIDWRAAKTSFQQALDAERKLRAQRQSWFERIGELAKALAREKGFAAEAERRQQAEINSAIAEEAAAAEHERARIEHESASATLASHASNRPGIIRVVFTLGRAYRNWNARSRELATVEREARKSKLAAQELADAMVEIQEASTGFRTAAERTLAKEREVVERLRKSLAEAKQVLGEHFPSFATWHTDDVGREKSSPWVDPAWNAARTRVFMEALNLHKAFVISQAADIGKNLTALFDVLQGNVPADAAHAAVRAAWQTLFFIVPVVSTTFASLPRLFEHLGREELGWLLIDEAGQAVPQSAVGGIWRAKRAIVVGDPLQLEPVLTIPFSAQQALRGKFDVSETWLPGRLSTQKLADRVATVGTVLVDHERKPLWVSSPLRVHRRCDEEMFRISNKIAYNDMMVFGTEGRKPFHLPPSAWIHVESADAEGHWIPAEGEMALSILRDVAPETRDKIYVISPFRDVVRGLESLLHKAKLSNVEVGTIHTVQGKESDVVLLVLGGNPKRPGAKAWASKKPNLLNVAVSRAKRRIYVIGNRRVWEQFDNFDKCSAILGPQSEWVPPVPSYLQ